MKKYTKFRPRIRSRHPSHRVIRPNTNNLPLLPFKSIIRLGSTTHMSDTITNNGNRIELNTVNAIKNSANKLLMKQSFSENNVKTANWWKFDGELFYKFNTHEVDESQEDELIANFEDLPYPIISKHIYGSRGSGNIKHNNPESLKTWMENRNLDNYIFEKYYSYLREYRLHVDSDGCFYTCRKMLKRDTPENSKWYRNNDHCVWIMEDNELFDKPTNWNDIVNESVKALNSVGLDFGAVDVKIQSATNKEGKIRDYPEFIIIEINSAPSFGKVTAEKYIEQLPKLLNKKYEQQQ